MSVKLNSIGQIEKTYAFEDAIVNTEILNGAFGAVTSGVFAPAANATKVVMNVEVGDNVGLDEYKIASGSHVRVLDLVELATQYPENTNVEIYGVQVPSNVAVNDKLVSDATGSLVKNASATAPYLQVTRIIGNKLGVETKIVTE